MVKHPARGRVLARSISLSERISAMSLKAALLFTWMIACADDQGRMRASPKWLKNAVVPLRDDIPVDEIPKLLDEMHEAELIMIYNNLIPAVKVLQLLDWWSYQMLDSPQASDFPPPYESWKDRVAPRDEHGRFAKREDANRDGNS